MIIIPELLINDIGRFWSNTNFKTLDTDECITWDNKNKKPSFSINGNKYLSSRVAYKLHYNQDPGDKVVCHSCNNQFCMNGKHLYLSTQKEATQKYYKEGGQPSFGNQKLSESDKQNIKELRKQNMPVEKIAEQYNVTRQCIYKIIK